MFETPSMFVTSPNGRPLCLSLDARSEERLLWREPRLFEVLACSGFLNRTFGEKKEKPKKDAI